MIADVACFLTDDGTLMFRINSDNGEPFGFEFPDLDTAKGFFSDCMEIAVLTSHGVSAGIS